MKRKFFLGFALIIAGGLLAALAVAGWHYRTEQFHSALGNQICTAITPRAQVGGIRDSFDQAYAILHISSRAERSFAIFRDGLEEYGQRPPVGATFYSVECKIEGRPDMGLTLYFEKAPLFGKVWSLVTFAFILALTVLGIVFHALSARIVKIVQAQLSSGMDEVLQGRTRPHGLGQFFDAALEKAPAIRKLQRELEEKRRLASENSLFRARVSSLLEENTERETKEKTTAEIVSQVRHDLRSPLSYLKVFGQTLKATNMETYHLSVQKIDRILQDLNQIAGAELRLSGTSECCLVECVLQESIATKKSSWNRPVDISFHFSAENLNVAPVDPVRFVRIVDNILQNSFEALGTSGRIIIEAKRMDQKVAVSISDNGVGIPKDILSRLGSERVTFGKPTGNGIGLQTAKQWIEAWGGSLFIKSEQGKGTAVSILLTRLETKTNFVAEISHTPGQEIIVVDDEPQIARQLIERTGSHGQCFDSIAAYAKWLDNADLSSKKILSVYDLHLKPGNGLDLLRLHPWPARAVLYTNDYLNAEALELSAELGFSILPKAFVLGE